MLHLNDSIQRHIGIVLVLLILGATTSMVISASPNSSAPSNDLLNQSLDHDGQLPDAKLTSSERKGLFHFDPGAGQNVRTSAVSSNDWPMFQIDPSNSGDGSEFDGPDRNVSVKWSFRTDGEIQSAPVVVAGVVYVGSEDGYLYAIDAQSGEEKWRYEAEDDIKGAVAVDDDTVFFGDEDGYVHAIDVDTHDLEWRNKVTGEITDPVVVEDNTLYVVSSEAHDSDEGGNIMAFDTNSGERLWTANIDKADSPPAVGDNSAFVGMDGASMLRAVDTDSGEQNWQYEDGVGQASYMGPTIGTENVYAGDRNGELYSIDKDTGNKNWRIQLTNGPQTLLSSPVLADETLYVGGPDRLYAVDADDGDVQWKNSNIEPDESAPVLVENTLFASDQDGIVHAVDPDDGSIDWKYNIGSDTESSPAVVGEMIYIGDEEGRLLALREKKPANFEVDNLDAPDSATIGDTITVSATVSNNGDQMGTQTVEYRFRGQKQKSKSIELSGGESKSVQFTFDTDASPSGTYSHSISTVDDTTNTEITLNEPANIEISYSVDKTEVRPGEKVTVTIMGENTGGVSGTTDIRFILDGELRDTREVSVPAGAEFRESVVLEFENTGENVVKVNDLNPTVIFVRPVKPSAQAGEDIEVNERSTVVLNGTKSTDPNNDDLSFLWDQVSGPDVNIVNPNTKTPELTAPQVDSQTELQFRLTITDPDGNTDVDLVNVTVEDVPVLKLEPVDSSATLNQKLVLSKAPTGLSNYTASVNFDPDVINLEATIPPTLEREDPVSIQVVGSKYFGAKDPGDNIRPGGGNIHLATLEITAGTSGTTGLNITSAHLYDEQGNPIPVTTKNSSLKIPDEDPPRITDFKATNTTGQQVKVEFNSSEVISDIAVNITKNSQTVAQLGIPDFTRSQQPEGYHYEAVYNVDSTGSYTATLKTATDESQNDGASGQTDKTEINNPITITQSPETLTASPGTNVSFGLELRTPDNYNGRGINVELPANWEVISQTSPGGTYQPDGNKWVWLDSGTKSVEYTVHIPDDSTTDTYEIAATGVATNPATSEVESNVTVSSISLTEQENESEIADFTETTKLTSTQTTPSSLSGKIAVETPTATDTSVMVLRSPVTNYSIDITAPDDAENVTIYLQKQAISASQDIENLTMYIDGTEHSFVVKESVGPGNSPWVAFNVPHFSTRTVSFVAEGADMTTANISLANATVLAGNQVALNVTANASGAGIAGYEANFTFDPGAIQIESVEGGDFAAPITNINNTAGYITFTQSRATEISEPLLARVLISVSADASEGKTTLQFIQSDTSLNNKSTSLPIETYASGHLTITSCKRGDADQSGTLTPLDATKVLRTVAGLSVADPFSPQCADYTDDGQLSPLDATKILRDIAGLETAVDRSVAIHSKTGEVVKSDEAIETADLHIGDIAAQPNEKVTTSIRVDNASNVAGYRLNLTFDPEVVQITDVSGADFNSPITNIDNELGFVVLTQARANGLDEPILANLTFEIVGESATTSGLIFQPDGTSVNSESEELETKLHNGAVRIPTMSETFSIDDISTNSPIEAGESLTTTVEVTNVGRARGTQTLTLTINDTQVAERSVTLDRNSSTTIKFDWSTNDEDAGTYIIAIASENDTAEIRVQSVSTGTIEGTVTDQDGNPIEAADVSLDNGSWATQTDENGNFRFTEIPTGTYAIQAMTSETDQVRRTVTVSEGETSTVSLQLDSVEPDRPDLTVTDISTDPSNPSAKQDVRVCFTIANIGSASATSFDVEAASEGEPLASQGELSLTSGDENQVCGELTTFEEGAQTITARIVTNDEINETNESNNEYTETITVDAEEPQVSVTLKETNAPVPEGSTLNVSVQVTSPEGGFGEPAVLFVDGTERDSFLLIGPPGLPGSGSASRNLTLSWATTSGDAGEHTVRVRVGNASASTEVDVIETQPPTSAFTITPENPLASESVVFNAAGSTDPDGTISNYEWDFDTDGSSDATGEVVNYTFESPGEYSITLRVIDSDGLTDTITKNISVREANSEPTVDVSAPQSVEGGERISLDASDSSDPDQDSLEYIWQQTAGPSVRLENVTSTTPEFTAPEVDQERTLRFELKILDGHGHNATDTVSITIEPSASANTPTPSNDTPTPSNDTATPPNDTATPPIETASPTTNPQRTETSTTPVQTRTPGLPGFGVPVTLVAILVVLVIARRQ